MTITAVPAKKRKRAERGVSAGSVCDKFIAIAADEEQNEPDGTPKPARFCFLAGTALTIRAISFILFSFAVGWGALSFGAEPSQAKLKTLYNSLGPPIDRAAFGLL